VTRNPGAPSTRVYGSAMERLRQVAPVEAEVIERYVRGLRSEAAAWRIRARATSEETQNR
jgi:hypothetical protein